MGSYFMIHAEISMRRTEQQKKAIEVYCREVAKAMNDEGHDLKAVLTAKKVDVPCTQQNIKDVVFKGIEQALFPEKTSTTQLTTGEVNEIYDVMNRWLANNFSIHVPFPSEENEKG